MESPLLDLNLTFILEAISFCLFFYLNYRIFWPAWLKMLDARANKIADGLKNAERVKEALEEIDQEKERILKQSNLAAKATLQEAESNAKKLVDAAALAIDLQNQEKMEQAQRSLDQIRQQARVGLQEEIGALAIDIAKKLMQSQQWNASALGDPALKLALKNLKNDINS